MKNTPKPTRNTRFDGWSRTRQQRFLAVLADTGSVSEAARVVQMTRQSAYALRRHPDAHAFRAAWDNALVDAWRRVAETALERVVNGETEIVQQGGLQTVRHRPCSPHLVVHMLHRAERLLEQVRARDEAEADRQAHHAAAPAPPAAPLLLPPPADAETLALRRNHDLLHSLPNLAARPRRTAGTARMCQLRQLMAGTAAPPDTPVTP